MIFCQVFSVNATPQIRLARMINWQRLKLRVILITHALAYWMKDVTTKERNVSAKMGS